LGNEVGDTGGSETVTLSTTTIPAHTHTLGNHTHTGTTDSDGAHTHIMELRQTSGGAQNYYSWASNSSGTDAGDTSNADAKASGSAHSHAFTTGTPSSNTSGSTGTGDAHNNMQPALVALCCIKT